MTRLTIGLKSWRAALVAGALAGSCTITACGDDEPPGPPDGDDCTNGTITVGAQVGGTFTTAACTVSSELRNRPRLAQSWTLHAQQNVAYVVRLNPVGAVPDLDLVAITTGPGNQPVLATIATGVYQEVGESPDDALSAEMYLPSDRDQTISIRIEADDVTEGGSYTLEVFSCAIVPLTLEVPATPIEITGNCRSLAYPFATTPISLVFLGFEVDTAGQYTVHADRNTGNGMIRGFVAGPGLDVSDFNIGASVFTLIGSGTSMNQVSNIANPGWYTFVVGIPSGSTANFTAVAEPFVPPSVAAPGRR